MSCTDNAKVSDSGYANTCDNSHSQRSSGSSLSRNSNRSESSGYCGGHPSSTLGSSSQALPQPINKKKDEEHKKKKSKTAAKLNADESALKGTGQEMQYTVVPNELDELKKSDYLQEVGTVELVAAKDPSDHINHTNFTEPAADLSSQSNQDISSPETNAEFYAVVSLSDGLVLHTSASLQTALGYPKDAWIGQSFIDFIQPKDKATFTEKLTNNIALRFGDSEKNLDSTQTSVFCNLQRYSTTTLDSDTQLRDAKMCRNDKQITLAFSPFHLSLGFKQFRKFVNDEQSGAMLLTIKAQAVYSAYKVPDETIISPIFVTQHNAACIISHVDDEIVRYSGYRPQDMIGRCVFNFFHPEDMATIKSIYETVVKLEGSTFTSKPYRFAVQNGGYIILETDWSSFINPWGKKLELIIGHHRVLRGPSNPDVFQPVTDDLQHIFAISKEILRRANIIQEEIQTLLTKKIESATVINAHTKQSKDLVSFVDSLVLHQAKQSAAISRAPEAMETEEKSLSEHESVIFGDVSPHHEYCDSKSSSETPLSYNQLNYNEKLERFFNSKPTLAPAYGADEENMNSSKTSQLTPSNRAAGNHDSGGSGSDENLTSASNNEKSSPSRNDSVNSHPVTLGSVEVPTLTEVLLNIHNQDMEKLMVQEHKKRRSNNKNNKKKDVKIKSKTSVQEGQEKPAKSRARKRSGNHTHEGDIVKKSKFENKLKAPEADSKAKTIDKKMDISNSTTTQPPAIIDMWPQIAVNANPPNVSRCMVYYVPVPESKINSSGQIWNPRPPTSIPQNSYVSYAATSLAGVIYPSPVVSAVSTSMIYGPTMVMNVPLVSSKTTQKPVPLPERIRPSSQATSVKAEPGSVMCLSESSKKLLSPGGHLSSCVSNSEPIGQSESSFEDSSDSSFYGSFLHTSSGSSNGHPNPWLSQDKNVWASRKDETTQLRHFGMIDGLKADFALQTARGVISPQQLLQNRIPPPRFEATRQILGPAALPWKRPAEITPKLNFNYQITPAVLSEVLKADAEALKKLTQPSLVNDQLEQLYRELELEGFSTKLILEGDSESSNENDHVGSDVRPKPSPQQNCCSTKEDEQKFSER